MKAQPDVLPKVDTEKELDYYNNRENRLRVFARDDYICHYCRKQLTRFSATLDHIQPVSEGGDNSLHNLVTSCLHCNSNRGSKPVSDFIEEEADKSIQRTPQGGAADLLLYLHSFHGNGWRTSQCMLGNGKANAESLNPPFQPVLLSKETAHSQARFGIISTT